MSCNDLYNLRMRNKPKGAPYQKNYDAMCNIEKTIDPSFDGFSKSTTTTWVHKLDPYFHLNLMIEEKEIKFSTLHSDGGNS
jgi:hypothetical protein